MLSGQGGGSAQPRARYSGTYFRSSRLNTRADPTKSFISGLTGAQQWYQPGGALPDDVYTYKDVQKGIGKIWNKVRRRSSASSTSSTVAEALSMEKEGKAAGGLKDIQHIEECSEDEEEEEVEEAVEGDEICAEKDAAISEVARGKMSSESIGVERARSRSQDAVNDSLTTPVDTSNLAVDTIPA